MACPFWRMGDPVGGRMGERIGAADDEALEGQAGIERRAAEFAGFAAPRGGRQGAESFDLDWSCSASAMEGADVGRGASLARRWAAGSRPSVLRTPMEMRPTSPVSER